MQRLDLIPHPVRTAASRIAITVEIDRDQKDRLALWYVVSGDIGEISLPAPMPPMRADSLWKRTCFEGFVGAAGTEAYYEFNFSPSGAWAAYRFDAYRQGMAVAEELGDPEIKFFTGPSSIRLGAIIRLPELLLPGKASPLRVGLSAVIEEITGAHAYWALAHPPGKPDFHQRDCFLLELTREARP